MNAIRSFDNVAKIDSDNNTEACSGITLSVKGNILSPDGAD